MKTREITTLILVFVIALLIGWDIYADMVAGTQGTISSVVHDSAVWPAIPFFVGCLCGHFFLGMKETKETKETK